MAEKLEFVSTLNDAAFVRGIRGMESQAEGGAKKIGAAFSSLASPLAALAPAIAAAFTGGAIAAGVKQVFDFTEGLGDLSDQTGVGVGRLSVLGRVFENAGFAAEDAGTAINKMQVFLAGGLDGNSKTADGLRDLGLNFLEIKDLAPEKQFNVIGAAIAALDSPMKRVAAARDIFGKSGGKLMAVFNDPESNANNALSERAKLLERNANLFADVSIKLGKIGGVFKGFYAGVAEEVATPLDALLDRIESVNLIKLGQGFGGGLIEGASGVVDMLLALKRADILPTAEGFAKAMKSGADFLVEGVQKVQEMLKDDARIITWFQNVFGQGEINPPTTTGATPASAASTTPAASPSSDKVAIPTTGTPLDDMTSTGVQMRHKLGIGESLTAGPLGDGGGINADGGEAYRQNSKQIRDQLQYASPLMSGGALSAAVVQEQNKRRDQKRIDDYRRTYDVQHPAEAEARKKQEEANKSASAGDVRGTTKAVEELGKKIEMLFAQ